MSCTRPRPRTLADRLPLTVAVVAFYIAITSGCAEHYHDLDAFLTEPHPIVAQRPYYIAPPDVLLIHSKDATELHNRRAIVGPDGSLDLPLVGKVQVAGRTVEQVGALLEEKAGQYYHEPDVSVSVAAYRSKHIYVFGEVLVPGRYAYTGSDTLLSVLSVAQPTRACDPKRVQLYRPAGDGQNVSRMTIDLDEWVKHGVTDRNTLMEDGDIVFVPPNALAEVGYAFQNLLRPVQPAASTVRGTTNIDQDYDRISAN